MKRWLFTREPLVGAGSRGRSWIVGRWVYRRIHLAGWRRRSSKSKAGRTYDSDPEFCCGTVPWTDPRCWIHDPTGHWLPKQFDFFEWLTQTVCKLWSIKMAGLAMDGDSPFASLCALWNTQCDRWWPLCVCESHWFTHLKLAWCSVALTL